MRLLIVTKCPSIFVRIHALKRDLLHLAIYNNDGCTAGLSLFSLLKTGRNYRCSRQVRGYIVSSYSCWESLMLLGMLRISPSAYPFITRIKVSDMCLGCAEVISVESSSWYLLFLFLARELRNENGGHTSGRRDMCGDWWGWLRCLYIRSPLYR